VCRLHARHRCRDIDGGIHRERDDAHRRLARSAPRVRLPGAAHPPEPASNTHRLGSDLAPGVALRQGTCRIAPYAASSAVLWTDEEAGMRAADVMTFGAASIRPDAPVEEAARVMLQHRISGL